MKYPVACVSPIDLSHWRARRATDGARNETGLHPLSLLAMSTIPAVGLESVIPLGRRSAQVGVSQKTAHSSRAD
jgi:hypothetical protein